MARTKKSSKKSAKGQAVVKKEPKRGRVIAKSSEYTRKRSAKFAIAGAHFRRIAKSIVPNARISAKALDALQRYVESSMNVQLSKARKLMDSVDKSKKRRTLTARYLDIVDACEAPSASAGSIYLA